MQPSLRATDPVIFIYEEDLAVGSFNPSGRFAPSLIDAVALSRNRAIRRSSGREGTGRSAVTDRAKRLANRTRCRSVNLSCAASRVPLGEGLDCQWQLRLAISLYGELLLTSTESAGSGSILPSLANAGCDSGAGAATLCPAPARKTTVSNFPIVPRCRRSRCSAKGSRIGAAFP